MEAAVRWDVVSGVAAAVTVVVAVIGLWFAKEAAEAARDTVSLAEASRRADERDRLRRRIDRVGDLAEEVFFQAIHGSPDNWMIPRNRLRGALIGMRERLPVTTRLVDTAMTADQAAANAKDARQEVEGELTKLAMIDDAAADS
jgi:hypothetical protein